MHEQQQQQRKGKEKEGLYSVKKRRIRNTSREVLNDINFFQEKKVVLSNLHKFFRLKPM